MNKKKERKRGCLRAVANILFTMKLLWDLHQEHKNPSALIILKDTYIWFSREERGVLSTFTLPFRINKHAFKCLNQRSGKYTTSALIYTLQVMTTLLGTMRISVRVKSINMKH